MLTNNLDLRDSDGTASLFAFTRTEAGRNYRIDTATNLALPRWFITTHSDDGKKSAAATDRHLLSIDEMHQDDNGAQVRLVTNLTFAVPRNPIITRRMVADQIARLVQLLAMNAPGTAEMSLLDEQNGILAAVLRGEG